jgi:hypothetical protein
MPYPSPEDIYRAKQDTRIAVLVFLAILLSFLEFGFIFYILLTA